MFGSDDPLYDTMLINNSMTYAASGAFVITQDVLFVSHGKMVRQEEYRGTWSMINSCIIQGMCIVQGRV